MIAVDRVAVAVSRVAALRLLLSFVARVDGSSSLICKRLAYPFNCVTFDLELLPRQFGETGAAFVRRVANPTKRSLAPCTLLSRD